MEFVMSSGVETSQVLAEKRDPSTSLGMTLGGDGASPPRLRPQKFPPENRKRPAETTRKDRLNHE